MREPRICAAITTGDLAPVRQVEPLVDMYEVRIDLIGEGWTELVPHLGKPWIACNRTTAEGGQWQGSEARRIEKLLQAVELGASIVDVELSTRNLGNIVKVIRRRASCLLSYHDLEKTPSFATMKRTVQQQAKAGADICKVVTTARSFEDNVKVLRLIAEFPDARVVSFAMGVLGAPSRVLCPLVGGDFTYASVEKGKESAPGQVTVEELKSVYQMVVR
jgi:3-dehydroquinate dehydratase type I